MLDVAVRRARRLGRGGNITGYIDRTASEVRGPLAFVEIYRDEELVKIPVLIPGLADAQRILDVLGKLDSYFYEMLKVEGRKYSVYEVNVKLLPPDLHVALKEVAETVVILNTDEYKGIRDPIGAPLTTCNPKATRVVVIVDKQEKTSKYYIRYFCKSHMDGELKLWGLFRVREDKLGKYLMLESGIDRP
jgi:hypothetical protein